MDRRGIVIFDIDGTLTREISCWQYLHEQRGTWEPRGREAQERFFRGEMTYDEWCEHDAGLLAGMPLTELERILASIRRYNHVDETLQQLREAGFGIVLLSSGLTHLAWQFAPVDSVYANELLAENGLLTGQTAVNIHIAGKGEAIPRIEEEFGLPRSRFCAVGDSTGDIPVFRRVPFSIALNPRDPVVEEAATVTLHTDSLRVVGQVVLEHFAQGLGSTAEKASRRK
jgi:phosphoserine phosphatase